MTHSSEDELLGYALEVIASDKERAGIAAHLAMCSECRARLENLQKDIDIIGGVRPRQRVLRMANPRPREATTYAILKSAALIILGIFVGLGASNWAHREPEFVSSAYVTLSSLTDSLTAYTVSDATDVSVHSYEQILEQRK
jgi:anti-sigma factor RsiW